MTRVESADTAMAHVRCAARTVEGCPHIFPDVRYICLVCKDRAICAIGKHCTPRDIAERALAHTVANKVKAADHHSDLIEQRRPMLETWAASICGKADGFKSLLPCHLDAHRQGALFDHSDTVQEPARLTLE